MVKIKLKERGWKFVLFFALLGILLVLFISLGILLFDNYNYVGFGSLLFDIFLIILFSFFIGGIIGLLIGLFVIRSEFAKLTMGKIILTVILTLIIIYFIYTSTPGCLAVILTECQEGYQLYIPPGGCTSCMTDSQIIFNKISIILGPLIFSYLLSCLIIFSYNKLKRKK